MASNRNNNKSMFLYTALIFVVAIVLIIISFFGQANLEKNQPKVEQTLQPAGQLENSISQRASVLSEENMVLLEENQGLKEENEKLQKQVSNTGLLTSAANFMAAGNKEGAAEQLSKINQELLTETEKSLFAAIQAFVNE